MRTTSAAPQKQRQEDYSPETSTGNRIIVREVQRQTREVPAAFTDSPHVGDAAAEERLTLIPQLPFTNPWPPYASRFLRTTEWQSTALNPPT